MKVLVLYRPLSDHGSMVEEFIDNFKARGSSEHLEVLDIDSREGSSMATLYDVVRYPAVLVVQGDGSLQRAWEGDKLPLVDEVQAYARG